MLNKTYVGEIVILKSLTITRKLNNITRSIIAGERISVSPLIGRINNSYLTIRCTKCD